jgi:hypothetical protein
VEADSIDFNVWTGSKETDLRRKAAENAKDGADLPCERGSPHFKYGASWGASSRPSEEEPWPAEGCKRNGGDCPGPPVRCPSL